MPTSRKQQQLACADLERKRKGKPTRTDMSEAQLQDMCETPVKKTRKKRTKRA